MLKLYSWKNIFSEVISEKRKEEMAILWQRFRLGQIVIVTLYFFPQLLSAVVFSVFIGTGNTLSLGVAYTVMTLLNMIKEPLRTLPLFIG